jgi:hypothetical protein
MGSLMSTKILIRLSVAFMLAVSLFGFCLLTNVEKSPYKYHYERDGTRYYLYCTDERCTLVTESEVPEKWRK